MAFEDNEAVARAWARRFVQHDLDATGQFVETNLVGHAAGVGDEQEWRPFRDWQAHIFARFPRYSDQR